jgi:hypothetical protein
MAFNINDYETVEVRLGKFIADYPDFMVHTELLEHTEKRFIVLAKIYRTCVDSQPFATGLAYEIISDRGVNSTSALENAETSSLGRALANAGYAAKGKRPSQSEMAKVIAAETEPKSFKEKLESRQNLYGKSGNSAIIETALRESFAADLEAKKEPEQIAWSIGDAIDAIGTSTPKEPPACEHGHILKQGISKGKGKPYYGYVCKKGVTEHAKWAKSTANGHWYFEEDTVQ